MKIIKLIKSSPLLKSIAIRLLVPKNEARPRTWVKIFLNPFKHVRGKGSIIRRNTRIDVLPFQGFIIGSNSVIEDFTTLNNGLGPIEIGNNSLIGMSNVIIGPVYIGNNVILAQNVVLSGLNHTYEDIDIPISLQKCSTKSIFIEDDCWIGANVVVTSGVTIGKHSVVAAGSVVTKDVSPYSVVAGNPAIILKQYNNKNKKWERKRL